MSRFDFELRPSDVIAQANDAIVQFRNADELLLAADQALRNYTIDPELYSQGFELTKVKCEDYRTAITSFRLGISSHIGDFTTLINEVSGTTNLIGHEIETGRNRALKNLQESENEISRIQGMINSGYLDMRSGSTGQTYGQLLGIWQRNKETDQELLGFWLEREQEYRRIEAVTRTLLDVGNDFFAKALSGLGYITTAARGLPNSFQGEGLTSWREDVTTIKNVFGTAALGLSPEQVQFARELGYTPKHLITLFKSFETEGDSEFFRLLLNGDEDSFRTAFMVNPWALSNAMTVTMSDFAKRLFTHDEEHFESFVNALLSTDIAHSSPAGLGPRANYGCFRQEYLLRMFLGTSTSLDQNSFLIAFGLTDEDTQTRHNTQIMLSTFWSTLSIINSEVRRDLWLQNARPIDISIIGLHTYNGSIYFDLFHGISGTNTIKEINVRTEIIMYGRPFDEAARIARLAELREAYENFSGQWWLDTAWGAVRTAAVLANPKTVVVFITLDLLANGDIPNSSSINKAAKPFIGDDAWLDSIDIGGFALDRVVSYVQGLRALENALAGEQRREFMRWFGSGAHAYLDGVRVPVLLGAYNPNTIQHALTWEDQGLYGLGILDDGQIDIITNPVRSDGRPSRFGSLDAQLQEDVELLLRGGFSLIGEYDSGITLDVERFLDAIYEIDAIIRNSRYIEYMNIRARWDELVIE